MSALFHFTYATTSSGNSALRQHYLRDGDAALALTASLVQAGYTYGGIVPNFPYDSHQAEITVENQALRPGDILLLTTRPPLDDDEEYDRRVVRRSHTTLEQYVLDALAAYLPHCDRGRVELHHSGVHVDHSFQKQHQPYLVDRRDERATMGYLIYTGFRANGPSVMCAFGVGGVETLVWADWLARSLGTAILDTSVLVAEMRAPHIYGAWREGDGRVFQDFRRFAGDWTIEVKWRGGLCSTDGTR